MNDDVKFEQTTKFANLRRLKQLYTLLDTWYDNFRILFFFSCCFDPVSCYKQSYKHIFTAKKDF